MTPECVIQDATSDVRELLVAIAECWGRSMPADEWDESAWALPIFVEGAGLGSLRSWRLSPAIIG